MKLKFALSLLSITVMLIPGISLGNDVPDDPANNTEPNVVDKTADFLSDTAVTTNVKTNLFADKDIESLSISVTTNNGVVTLSGAVNTKAQKEKAVKITQKVNGVKSVIDELVVNPNS